MTRERVVRRGVSSELDWWHGDETRPKIIAVDGLAATTVCRSSALPRRLRNKCLALNKPVDATKSKLRVEPLYLDKAEAAVYLAVSVSTFEKLLREDATFPRPRALSANRNGYLVAELRAWGETRPVADRLPPVNTGRTVAGPHRATSPTAPNARSAW